ncbi:MAG: aminotransferase class I/II-fold pyridoxal phosphate-dependent enzyme [Parcubacteria group bacterium]
MNNNGLPQVIENKFQKIKRQCKEAEAKGIKLYKLSIGQPTGPALLSARKGVAEAVMSDEESMFEYQDNGSPGVPDFARKFIQAHVKTDLGRISGITFLPILGIKSILGLIPMACGGIGGNKINMYTMTEPGYPTPVDQAELLGMIHRSLTTNPGNRFLFPVNEIDGGKVDLVMTNFPHNPSGQIATRKFWEKPCAFCEKHNIRLFNDAAYAILTYSKAACTLTEVAVDFPNLQWAEAYSASKVIANGTDFRVGAIVGSPDFVDAIAKIKGKTDSGFFAPAAAGVLYAIENDWEGIMACRDAYARKIKFLIPLLESCGMQLAVKPRATFFTLWMSPKKAFGRNIKSADEFNELMIAKTGIVGVPFDPYMRYAVTSQVEEWEKPLKDGFKKARIAY